MGANGEIVRRYIKAYEKGNGEEVGAFLHPEHTYYPPGGGDPVASLLPAGG